MADYTEAVSFLQKTSSASGGTVYDTLASMVDKILEERPADAVDLLETCLLVKKTAFSPKDAMVTPASAKDTAGAVAAAELFATPEPPINEETGEPEALPEPNVFVTEDVVADGNLFAAVGAGLGSVEMYKVMLAMKKLGEDPEKALATVRFFGKFLGTGGDYYVFEATLKTPTEPAASEEEDPSIVPPEANSGTNAWTYFVCSALGGPVTALPDVTPQQVVISKSIKKYLTGNLDAEVSAYPVFPGKEASYLRAQIARIAAATVLCPAGFFSVGEDGTSLEKVEDFAPASPEDQAALTSFAHRYQHIKAQGRCALYEPPVEEGEEPPTEEPEVSPALLSTVDADAELSEGVGAWAVIKSSTIAAVKYKVVGVRSSVWPGAVCVAAGTTFSNMYVGYGVKATPYVPPAPPAVAAEAEAPVEQSDLPLIPEPEPEEEAPAEE